MDLKELPFVSVPLPSCGLVYPKINIDGVEKDLDSVSIRSMTARDENILHSPALLKSGKALPMVIQNCMTEPKNIQIGDLLLSDNAALILFLRIISYGSEVEASEVTCPICDQKFSHNFSLGNLDEKKLTVAPVVPNTNEFEKVLAGGTKIRFRLSTVRMQEELDNIMKIKRKKGLQEDIVTTTLRSQIISVNGEQDKTKIANYIDTMSARESTELRSYIRSIEPDITPKAEIACPACGELISVVVPLGLSFFWPDRV